MQKYFMNSKVVLLALLLLGNSFLMHAQTITDTIFVKHPGVAFHKYGSISENKYSILYVINIEYDILTQRWNLVVDVYGEDLALRYLPEEKVIRSMGNIHFENLYKDQIEKEKWIKGDSVKNGYWIQCYDGYNLSGDRTEGYVVNGMQENKWIEYDQGKKKHEGNYINDLKDGVWHETWLATYYENLNWNGVEMVGQYKKGLKQGEWLEYQNSDKLKQVVRAKMFYVNDTLEGHYIRWEGSDKKYVLEEGNYIHGLRNGEWFVFHGKAMQEHSFWENGIPGKTIIYVDETFLHKGKRITVTTPYNVNIVKWKLKDGVRIMDWYYQAIEPVSDSPEYYSLWEGAYGCYSYISDYKKYK